MKACIAKSQRSSGERSRNDEDGDDFHQDDLHFFEQFEKTLACHSRSSQIRHNVRNRYSMRAGLDYQRSAYPWLGHNQMIPLLAFEHKTIHFEDLQYLFNILG